MTFQFKLSWGDFNCRLWMRTQLSWTSGTRKDSFCPADQTWASWRATSEGRPVSRMCPEIKSYFAVPWYVGTTLALAHIGGSLLSSTVS